jgi:hypothetical protein
MSGAHEGFEARRMRTYLFATAIGCLACGLGAAQASAQTIQTAQPPIAEPSPEADAVVHVDSKRRIDLKPQGPQPVVMRLRPGGQLLASFDVNGDGVISKQELLAGAQAAFEAADANHDGVVSGLEQTAWATSYGGINDVLSNPMMFDSNLDHLVSKDEFIAGVMRLAEPAKDSTGGVPVSKLMIAERPDNRRERPDVLQTPPGQQQRGGFKREIR